MKKLKLLIVMTIVFIVATSGLLIASAYQENNFEIPCEHEYVLTSFNNGVATFTCTECDDSYTDKFDEHINETNYEPLDVVKDGIINAKDYAYLIHKFK